MKSKLIYSKIETSFFQMTKGGKKVESFAK